MNEHEHYQYVSKKEQTIFQFDLDLGDWMLFSLLYNPDEKQQLLSVAVSKSTVFNF